MRIVGPILQMPASAKAKYRRSSEKVSAASGMDESSRSLGRKTSYDRDRNRGNASFRNETHSRGSAPNSAPQSRYVAQVLGQITPRPKSDALLAANAYAQAAKIEDMRFIRWA
jgi:hypothetical protein